MEIKPITEETGSQLIGVLPHSNSGNKVNSINSCEGYYLAESESGETILIFAENIDIAELKLRAEGYTDCFIYDFDKIIK